MSELRHVHPQQMRSFWPYNGFLLPIVPGPNMPLPAPPSVPCALPMRNAYPEIVSNNPLNVDGTAPGQFQGNLSSLQTHSRIYESQGMENERAGDCVGYTLELKNGEQAQNLHGFQYEQDFKEPSFSPRGSSTVNSSDSDQLNNLPLRFSAPRHAGDGSSYDSLPLNCNASTSKINNCFNHDGPTFNSDGTVTVSQSKYLELTHLALRGSEIAEKLAYTHRNRPCFKKIDSLCARMKQDVIRPDGVLPNINSQGIAWAIKDMIFVFTRIISAWIIIKGYVFNTPEGLNKVKSALCKDFISRFLVWQDATFDFAESLVRSFVSLDNLVQSQKTAHQKSSENPETNHTSPPKTFSNSTLFDDKFELFENCNENLQPNLGNGLNKNYLYTMVKDSENSQREATVNGTYFKTGTYNPIKKDDFRTDYVTPKTVTDENQNNIFSTPSTNLSPAQTSQMPNVTFDSPLQASMDEEQMLEANEMLNEFFDEGLYQKLATGELDVPMVEQYLRERLPNNWLDYGTRMFWRMFAERMLQSVKEPKMKVKTDQNFSNILSLMVDQLTAMRSSDLFFKLQFAKNYFPKFIAKYENNLIDIRTILLKSQENKYGHAFELVHDVRRIFFFAKAYLEGNADHALVKAINEFETDFDNLLHTEPFNLYCYNHIVGDPRENLRL